jgi:hypothetical protein
MSPTAVNAESALADIDRLEKLMQEWSVLGEHPAALVGRYEGNQDLLTRYGDQASARDCQELQTKLDNERVDYDRAKAVVAGLPALVERVCTALEEEGMDSTALHALDQTRNLDVCGPVVRLLLRRLRTRKSVDSKLDAVPVPPDWSRPESVKTWAKVYGVHRNTMAKRLQAQSPRNQTVGGRYMVALDDLPASARDKYRPRRQG